MRIAVAGSGGFVGSAVVSEARRRGLEVVPILSPRLHCSPADSPSDHVRSWMEREARTRDALVESLGGVDVVVNAAGLATPECRAVPALFGANSALPGLLACTAAEAGVRRMVHVSSAAVQGRRHRLDETPLTAPVTPYGDSKARGEAFLLERRLEAPNEIAVYRPTSVQGVDRGMTRQLARLARLPAIPSCQRGQVPLPVTLIENVAAGILHVCTAQACPSIVLQPWEGLTVRSLLACFGSGRIVGIPRAMASSALTVLWTGGRLLPAVAAVGRRLELLVFGQEQDAKALVDLGFSPPSGLDGYRHLADRLVRRRGSSMSLDSLRRSNGEDPD